MSSNTLNRGRAHANRQGFALVEAAVVAVVIGMLVAVLVVSGERARRTAMIGEDLSNLRQIGQLTGQYANDFEDKFWSFSWKKGDKLSQWPDLNVNSDNLQAIGSQATDIIRRISNRDQTSMPYSALWLPSAIYSHLPLMDYAGLRPAVLGSTVSASRLFVGSGDRNRLLWISDVDGFEKNKFGANQPPSQQLGYKRWPYSTSYRVPLHLVSTSFGQNSITNAAWNGYIVPAGAQFDAKKLTEVAYPSNKVLLHESHGRHHGKRQPYFSVSTGEARVPLLTIDGAADTRATRDGNKGWLPLSPMNAGSTCYAYTPNSWDPPTVTGVQDQCSGYYTYTRSAEKGRDFGGPEVPHQP